jgi:site-specific DNA-methyltransferase (adenine-specific)
LDISKALDKLAGVDRQVVGQQYRAATGRDEGYGFGEIFDITAPATLAAQIWDGWGTALKPAHEPICVARKPLALGTVAANVLAYGVGGLNIDGCRVAIDPAADASQLCTMAVSQHDGADGWGMNTSRANPAARVLGEEGRWPANFIHDGSPEVLAMFPQATGAKAPVRGTEASPASDGQVGNFRERVASAEPRGDAGSAARFYQQCTFTQDDLEAALFHYCAKASKREKGADNTHPTVKSIALGRYLARLICPPGGTLLDLFAGSGSFGVAAKLEGFSFVGFELDGTHAAHANRRLVLPVAVGA